MKQDIYYNYLYVPVSVVCNKNQLERGTHSSISYNIYQYIRFSYNPKKEHGEAVISLGIHLLLTKDKRKTLKHNDPKDSDIYINTDFTDK